MATKRGKKKGGRGRKGGKAWSRTAASACGAQRPRVRSGAPPDLILFHSESLGEDIAWPPAIVIPNGKKLDVFNMLETDIEAESTAFGSKEKEKEKKTFPKGRGEVDLKATSGVHKLDLPPLGLQLNVEGAPRRSKKTFGDPDIIIT